MKFEREQYMRNITGEKETELPFRLRDTVQVVKDPLIEFLYNCLCLTVRQRVFF